MVKYVCKWTSQLTDAEVNDFTFGPDDLTPKWQTIGPMWFDWMFLQNVYGDSIHVLVYDECGLVGRRALWRNDVGGEMSFQPMNTYVASRMRRKGIFSKMTKVALEEANGAYIYNFPNKSSVVGYLKLGWQVRRSNVLGLYAGLRKAVVVAESQREPIPEDYFRWRFLNSPLHEYYVSKLRGISVLLKKRKLEVSINAFVVVGGLGGIDTDHLQRVSPLMLFAHNPGQGLVCVRKNDDVLVENTLYQTVNGDVSLWRSDTI